MMKIRAGAFICFQQLSHLFSEQACDCAILEHAIQSALFVRGSADEDLNVPDKKTAYDPTTFPFADPAAPNQMATPPFPEQIELYRDRMWRRDEDLRIESAVTSERGQA
jgi:hypothetical protein